MAFAGDARYGSLMLAFVQSRAEALVVVSQVCTTDPRRYGTSDVTSFTTGKPANCTCRVPSSLGRTRGAHAHAVAARDANIGDGGHLDRPPSRRVPRGRRSLSEWPVMVARVGAHTCRSPLLQPLGRRGHR